MAEIVKLSVKTGTRTELVDITPRVGQAVAQSGVESGVVHVYSPHTTCGLTINENADPSVKTDILMVLNQVVPWKADYQHLEGNSPAHVKTTVAGPSLTVFVDGGRMVLGTWQGIFLCEFDGPRTRNVLVKVVQD